MHDESKTLPKTGAAESSHSLHSSLHCLSVCSTKTLAWRGATELSHRISQPAWLFNTVRVTNTLSKTTCIQSLHVTGDTAQERPSTPSHSLHGSLQCLPVVTKTLPRRGPLHFLTACVAPYNASL